MSFSCSKHLRLVNNSNKNYFSKLNNERCIIFKYFRIKEICSIIILINSELNKYIVDKKQNKLIKLIISYDFGDFSLNKNIEKYNKFNFYKLFKQLKGDKLMKKAFHFYKEWTDIYPKETNNSFICKKNVIIQKN